ncbi:hypothetical protein R3P38DRAFT_3260307 [Favolaschia claudopus]|uniref:Uncharacterized protein n=1 Tax=Favolaschia claudopus TaxID=2862362 RepID=A0AAW0CSU0_9AGAR
MLLSESAFLHNAYPMDTIYTFLGAMSEILPVISNLGFFKPSDLSSIQQTSIFSSKSNDGKLPSKHNLLPVVSLLTSTYPAFEAFSDEYEVEYFLVPPVPTSPLATVALPEITSAATVYQTVSAHAADLKVNQEEPLVNLKTRQNPKRVTTCRRFSPLRLARKASRGVWKVRIAFRSMILWQGQVVSALCTRSCFEVQAFRRAFYANGKNPFIEGFTSALSLDKDELEFLTRPFRCQSSFKLAEDDDPQVPSSVFCRSPGPSPPRRRFLLPPATQGSVFKPSVRYWAGSRKARIYSQPR